MVSARHFGIALKRRIAAGKNIAGGLPQEIHAAVKDLGREDDGLNVGQVRAVVVVAAGGLLGDSKTASDGSLPPAKHVVGKPESRRHLYALLGDEAVLKT